MLNLAEELMLLALHDEKGTYHLSAFTGLDYGLAGAVLFDLILQERLRLEKEGIRVVKISPPTGDDILDDALALIHSSEKIHKPQYWIERIPYKIKQFKRRLLDRLVDKGILEHEEHRYLWVFTSQRYPTKDMAPEEEIKSRISNALRGKGDPDLRTAILISLVSASSMVDLAVPKDERKAAKKRAKEIMKSNALSKAVSDVIDQIHAAVCTTITTTVVLNTVINN